jgi:NADP-dependent alcohol dehydrogenase
MWVLKEEKGDKIVQYGKRVFGIESNDRDEAIRLTIERTEEFFRSLGFKTRLSENSIPRETITEIETRFTQRGFRLGENRSVDGPTARKILEKVM